MKRMMRSLLGLLALTVVVSGCGTSQGANALDPHADHFKGLDPAVVAEVIADPIAVERISTWEPATDRSASAQATVIARILLRDACDVYVQWRDQGEPRPLAPLPVPEYPDADTMAMVERDVVNFQAAVDSGDIGELRHLLTEVYNGTADIPADPHQPHGPSIYDVVSGV